MSATPDTDSNPAASNTGIRRRTRPDSSGTGTGTGTSGGSASASASASGGGGDAPLQDLDTGRRRSSLRRKEFPWKEFLAFFAVVGYVLGYFYRKYGVAWPLTQWSKRCDRHDSKLALLHADRASVSRMASPMHSSTREGRTGAAGAGATTRLSSCKAYPAY